MYVIINGTPINNDCEQKCLIVDSLSLQEAGLKEFLLQCCIDFIEDQDNWVSAIDPGIDTLFTTDQAKWLLGHCIAQGDFGDILSILRVDDEEG